MKGTGTAMRIEALRFIRSKRIKKMNRKIKWTIAVIGTLSLQSSVNYLVNRTIVQAYFKGAIVRLLSLRGCPVTSGNFLFCYCFFSSKFWTSDNFRDRKSFPTPMKNNSYTRYTVTYIKQIRNIYEPYTNRTSYTSHIPVSYTHLTLPTNREV